MSLLIQHLAPGQRRRHSNSDYQSSRRGSAKHQHRASRRRRHHRATNCSAHEARKCAQESSRTTSPDTRRSPIALRTKKRCFINIASSLFITCATYGYVELLLRPFFHQISLVSIDAFDLTETVRRVTNPTRQNLIAQHGIDNRTFPIRCATEKCNFHVITC